MKRLMLVGVIAAVGAAIPGTVAASPSGLDGGPPPGLLSRGDPYTCGDQASIVFGGNGRSGWLNGHLYQATEFSGSFTFTPNDGDPISDSFSKSWGRGPKSGDSVVCTQSDSGEDEDGSWEWEGRVTAVMVPGS